MTRNTSQEKPLFHPTFGSRPAQIVGRDDILEGFLRGLETPIGSRNRCIFMIGQRGMGKTALLLEMADLAKEHNMVPALVTAYDGMNEEIIETLQRNGAAFFPEKRSVQGFEVGALGFSVGLTFNETTQQHYGFRTKLTLICDQLQKVGKGVLLLVDEATNSDAMRQLGITYQHLVGEEKNIVMVMAGLPQAVSSVLNDKVLTFLNRAEKIRLGPIGLSEIRAYYRMAFEKENITISEELLDLAVEATDGYPYLMQLIGYYLLLAADQQKALSSEAVEHAIRDARLDLEENVFAPVLAPLSDGDLDFLYAMSEDDHISKMSDLCNRLGRSNSFLQPYRARLLSAGVITAPRRGEVSFTLPYFSKYLKNTGNS